ncbi:MAG: hypothetical protein GX803_03770 [Lentisphaerae bacterium]|jgi:hypothetical protein|nr:hypothetical protein [Lentisphaerota bacterium]
MTYNEHERPFGDMLHQVISHLIRNAERLPASGKRGAIAFEEQTWETLPLEEKREMLQQIAEDTEAPSDVYRHFEAYPHAFSRRLYSNYLAALKNYKESLGL